LDQPFQDCGWEVSWPTSSTSTKPPCSARWYSCSGGRAWPPPASSTWWARPGVSRSSLYATFGDKHQLYLAALDRYLHDQLRAALRAALDTARRLGQLHTRVDVEHTAAQLALLAYGVNLRSRAGAPPAELTRTVRHVLAGLRKDWEPRSGPAGDHRRAALFDLAEWA
jgi:AcrR family transcriptional regulator